MFDGLAMFDNTGVDEVYMDGLCSITMLLLFDSRSIGARERDTGMLNDESAADPILLLPVLLGWTAAAGVEPGAEPVPETEACSFADGGAGLLLC